MKTFEEQYFETLTDIRNYGHMKKGRNGFTKSIHGKQIRFNAAHYFPILTSRQMFWKGVAGEYAAFIRGANHVDDFKKWGCNFWGSWADDNGFIKSDYGNAWIDYNESNQMHNALELLKNDPHSRRIIIDAWRPDRLSSLSLPCCHYNYQFVTYKISDKYYVDLIWTQRSADWMVGVPSDAISATIMLNCFASLADMGVGSVVMNFGDAHIYQEHDYQAFQLITNVWNDKPRLGHPTYDFKPQKDLYSFEPSDITLKTYRHYDKVNFKLMV